MNGIVEKLRFLASGQDDPQSVALDEAANEIERQSNQVAALIDLADMLRKDAAIKVSGGRNETHFLHSTCHYGAGVFVVAWRIRL